jgi:hypothetical protein
MIPGTNILRRPPEIKRRAILGVWPDYLQNSPAFLERAVRDCGDIARFRLVHQDAYLLNHPDWIKDVLVTNQANFTKSRMLERARGSPDENSSSSRERMRQEQRGSHQRRRARVAFS